MIKEWIDKQKAKHKLLKFYRMCNKRRKHILRTLNTLSQIEGTTIFDESTQKIYISDGKNFIEMC